MPMSDSQKIIRKNLVLQIALAAAIMICLWFVLLDGIDDCTTYELWATSIVCLVFAVYASGRILAASTRAKDRYFLGK